MNFEPRIILGPTAGSNADARTVTVRPMNERKPTPQQLGELARRFDLHTVKLRNSLAGFLTSDGSLSDGSVFRMVSNSGFHVLMIWPAGGNPPPQDLAEWFRAIPTSDSFRSGIGTDFESQGWKFPGKASGITHWPTSHKEISLRTDHPGHVTWSNPDLTVNKKPIVLAWRGPRDRYAATTGHAAATGGGLSAHEKSPTNFPTSVVPLTLAEDVLTDGPFVWINGHKVNTGVPKVIAACLHQYDPVDHPGQFVLRVCADRTIASSNRQMVVYDLVPTSGAAGATLKSFAKASATLFVKATYLAADNTNSANPGGGSPGAGKWDYWQRPHFNKSGTRLATLICKVGADGSSRESHAVSFDPTTWAVDEDVTAAITATYTTGPGSGGEGFAATFSDEQTFLVACDFQEDTFVYVELVVHIDVVESGVTQGDMGGGIYAGTQDRSRTTTYTVNHSALGELKTWITTDVLHMFYRSQSVTGGIHYTGDFHWDLTNITTTAVVRARAPRSLELAFFGDLSTGTFALGYQELGESSYTMAGSLDVTLSSGAPIPPVPVTASRSRGFIVFDVYFDGAKILDAVTGGYTNTATETQSGGYDEFMQLADQFGSPPRTSTANVNGAIARYAVQGGGIGPPSFEGRFGSGAALRAATYLYGAAAQHQHIAVHPEKAAAYLGGAFYRSNLAYGGTSDLPQGLELFVLLPSTTPTTENPEAYITGAHPTLSAPVFMGLGSRSGETT